MLKFRVSGRKRNRKEKFEMNMSGKMWTLGKKMKLGQKKKKLGCIFPLVYLNGDEFSMEQYTPSLPVVPSLLTYGHYEFGPLNASAWR